MRKIRLSLHTCCMYYGISLNTCVASTANTVEEDARPLSTQTGQRQQSFSWDNLTVCWQHVLSLNGRRNDEEREVNISRMRHVHTHAHSHMHTTWSTVNKNDTEIQTSGLVTEAWNCLSFPEPAVDCVSHSVKQELETLDRINLCVCVCMCVYSY